MPGIIPSRFIHGLHDPTVCTRLIVVQLGTDDVQLERSVARAKRIVTLEEVLKLAKQLSPVEKVRLIEQVAPEIEHDLIAHRPIRGVSLLGIVRDLGPAPTAEEIDGARRDAWANFPREDI